MTSEPFACVVHLVDDDDSFRASQRLFLTVMGFAVREWSSPVTFLEQADFSHPGCIVLDIRMPEMSGMEVQDALAQRACPLPIVILTGHGDVDTAVFTLKNGAADFLAKSKDPDLLLSAVRKACEKSREDFARRNDRDKRLSLYSLLTTREKEVLSHAALGLSNKEIGEKLGIGAETAKMHRANAFAKIDVRSALEAYRWLLACGILREPSL